MRLLIVKQHTAALRLLQVTRSFQVCLRSFSSVYSPSPPVSDSRAGFTDYERERREFQLHVPEFFNFADTLDEWARKEKAREKPEGCLAFWWINPDRDQEIKWSFDEMSINSKRVANMLSDACGVNTGERVMVILPRLPEWWLLNIACLRTGSIISPGSIQLQASDIHSRLMASQATCIVADPERAELIDQVDHLVPTLRTKLLVCESHQKERKKGWLSFDELYDKSSHEHQCVKTRSNDPMTVFFTSGTTGLPKMAEHTHASSGLGHIITGKFWLDLCPEDVHWTLSDTGWAKCAYGCLFGPWSQGACVFVSHQPKFEAKSILETLVKYPVSTFCSPPTAYRMMVLQDLKRYKFPKLRHCVSAGEPLNPEVMDEWKRKTGHEIREGYGQTETTLLCGSYRCIQNRPGSMGKPAPGYDVKVIDHDGKEVLPGVEGDVAVRVRPNRPVGLFTNYVDDPERTASVYRGDFYLTGDRATQDEDGYLWFVGRSDDVILSAGYRIGPFEVESALLEHAAVVEAAVVSSPDPVRGEVVKAFVLLSPYFHGNKEGLIQELQNHVKETTAPYKYPRKIEFVESLPKTISGKIRRVELRNKEWGRAESS